MEKIINTAYRLDTGVAHLTKDAWVKANRNYVCKAIVELMHENLLVPILLEEEKGVAYFQLRTDLPDVYYNFSGQHRAMDYWFVKPESIRKTVGQNRNVEVDAVQFFLEIKNLTGVQPLTLSKFMEETLNTLYADAYILNKGKVSSEALVDANYQTIEHQMDGHPWATVNKGRIGFSSEDYLEFVPEADRLIRLFWLAVHRSRAKYTSIEALSYQALMDSELGAETREEFNALLKAQELNPEEYFFVPVHEWQWKHKIPFLFAGDIAARFIIPLAKGKDQYTPQQSIRTFFNVDHPEKYYVKTAISILNTSIYRGLSPKKLEVAPVVTTWAKNKLQSDETLRKLGFTMLGEVATIGYSHTQYDQVENGPYHYKELLGAIWRESANSYLNPDERLMTMASLLYVDDRGVSFTQELIRKSGLSAEQWLQQYLKVYLTPILHIFYQHKFFFSPHGENTMLVMKNYVPERIIIKDFVEEIVLTQDGKAEAPEDVRNILRDIDDEYATLFILSGVFDGVFRYLSNIFHSYAGLDEDIFWKQVAGVIAGYQATHPELKERYEQFDLFVEEFIRVCINRVRLLTYGYSEDANIPVPEISGTLKNPVWRYRKNQCNEL